MGSTLGVSNTSEHPEARQPVGMGDHSPQQGLSSGLGPSCLSSGWQLKKAAGRALCKAMSILLAVGGAGSWGDLGEVARPVHLGAARQPQHPGTPASKEHGLKRQPWEPGREGSCSAPGWGSPAQGASHSRVGRVQVPPMGGRRPKRCLRARSSALSRAFSSSKASSLPSRAASWRRRFSRDLLAASLFFLRFSQ